MKYLSLLSPVLLPMGLILMSVSLSANAGGAMHCKQQVVNTGDTLTTVLEKCGSPAIFVSTVCQRLISTQAAAE
ncbi:DUF2845 domain-containing protein [Shewanella baltica]|uniref:DUF2845 domain-containing protein n=1 Tax=Shewanella baltica TaxID=62322 RepID=UPI00217D07FF|nr:DUF2845 domain-containing protein [Shewanella baltica]